MSVTKNFFQILAVQFLLFQSTNHISLMRQRYYKFEQFGACDGYPTNIGKVEKFLVTQPSKNQYYVDGEFSFFKNITAPIKLHIRSIRCSLQDDSRCIHNDGLQFYVCDHLNDENALWSPFIKSISPKLMCPIRMGTYKIENGTVDFSIIARLPLEGFRYRINFKFYEMMKSKVLDILCLDFKLYITTTANNSPRRRGKSH